MNTKLYPNNPHMNYYSKWHFLGNDGKADYYALPWSEVGNNPLCCGYPYLSVVWSDEASDYNSPDYERLFINEKYRSFAEAGYTTLYQLLLENGYSLNRPL
jgi:hypothetical protein